MVVQSEISALPVQCHNYNENVSNVKRRYRYLAMSLPYQRTCSLILHGPGPAAVVSVFINDSLRAVSGVKHVLLAPWEMTLLALSSGCLLGECIWTALQSVIEGRPTQIPVQPTTPEEPAWLGRLRPIHSFCEFNVSFILDRDWTAMTTMKQQSNSVVLSLFLFDPACDCQWTTVSGLPIDKPIQIIYFLKSGHRHYFVMRTANHLALAAILLQWSGFCSPYSNIQMNFLLVQFPLTFSNVYSRNDHTIYFGTALSKIGHVEWSSSGRVLEWQ